MIWCYGEVVIGVVLWVVLKEMISIDCGGLCWFIGNWLVSGKMV